MTEVDGACGEGGGQLVRTAVAIAAVRGVSVRIVNIRARRRRPGLAAQHVAAVRAVAALCDAHCEGVEVGSPVLTFTPGRLHGGEFEVDVGTAGSIALVLQAMLPAAIGSGQRVAVRLRGGTDVRAAPPLDYLRFVLLPLLARLGVHAELEVVRRGYFPPGGGEVRLSLDAVARLQPLIAETPGPLLRIDVHAHVARLPLAIARRMVGAARAALPAGVACGVNVQDWPAERAASAGGSILLSAACTHALLGAGEVALRGVPAERLGADAARALGADLAARATLDRHAVDQMLAYLALADEPSTFRAAPLSLHATTAMALLERLAGARFPVTPHDGAVIVRVLPAAAG